VSGRPPVVVVSDLSCGYRGRAVLEHVSFELSRGQVMALLGPNGVGKTTLFRTMLGLLEPIGGSVRMCGEPPSGGGRRRVPSHVAYVPQAHVPSFSFSVLEVVLMGRTPMMGAFATPSERDRRAAMGCLEALGLGAIADRPYTEVSGGERQMTLIARALAQGPEVLVMDEPAASLDLGNQARLLSMVRDLARGRGISVLMTTHNPDHALLVADRVLLMVREGARVSCVCGGRDEVLTAQNLSRAYGTRVEVIEGSGLSACALRLSEAPDEGRGRQG
jgi:iron complex transport system ATP-binding protein